MIDWVTHVISAIMIHLVDSAWLSFDTKGETNTNKNLSVEGSHSTKIQIKSHTDTQIWVSESPNSYKVIIFSVLTI